jgi:hypothetical protein
MNPNLYFSSLVYLVDRLSLGTVRIPQNTNPNRNNQFAHAGSNNLPLQSYTYNCPECIFRTIYPFLYDPGIDCWQDGELRESTGGSPAY